MSSKETNPKDAIAIKKPRFHSGMPANVTREVSVGLLRRYTYCVMHKCVICVKTIVRLNPMLKEIRNDYR